MFIPNSRGRTHYRKTPIRLQTHGLCLVPRMREGGEAEPIRFLRIVSFLPDPQPHRVCTLALYRSSFVNTAYQPDLHRKMTKPKRGSKASTRTDSVSPNRPRILPQERLLSRFYEPLVLLYTLGRTRADHVRAVMPSQKDIAHLPLVDIRRMFLSDLAYMCDYDKGGETVTAIGLQSTPQRHIFWIASNVGSKTKTIDFIRSILAQIVHVSAASNATQLATELASQCIAFATPRIKKYRSLLKPLLRRCTSYLAETKQAVGEFNSNMIIVVDERIIISQNPPCSNGCRVGNMRAVFRTCAALHMQAVNRNSCVPSLDSVQSPFTEATETRYMWLSA